MIASPISSLGMSYEPHPKAHYEFIRLGWLVTGRKRCRNRASCCYFT
jgi:hypothetical protein